MSNAPYYQLTYTLSNGVSQTKDLPYGIYIIGRSSECQIAIPVAEISRRHAQIEIAHEGCYIMDLGSANGTQVDGCPLPPRRKTPVTPGQTITLHSITLSIHQPGERVAVMTPPPPAASSSSQSLLKITRAGQSIRDFPLPQGEFFIGREQNCQLALDSPLISRKHASIKFSGGNLIITDLGSRNGILIQGQRIIPNQPVTLTPGNSFQIDQFSFEFIVNVPAQNGEIRTQVMSGAEVAALADSQVQSSLNLLGLERITIGRAPDNIMVLNHPNVSRYHAVIERMGTRSRIIDLHSANGI